MYEESLFIFHPSCVTMSRFSSSQKQRRPNPGIYDGFHCLFLTECHCYFCVTIQRGVSIFFPFAVCCSLFSGEQHDEWHLSVSFLSFDAIFHPLRAFFFKTDSARPGFFLSWLTWKSTSANHPRENFPFRWLRESYREKSVWGSHLNDIQ